MEMFIITYKIKNVTVATLIIIIFLIFLTNTKIVVDASINALTMCFLKLIPSIFPFMILSNILLNLNILDSCKKPIILVILSWISGFIVGPSFLTRLNKNEDISDYVALTSNAGIGYVISFVGITIWGNLMLGIILYFVQILSSLIIFCFSKKPSIKFESYSKKASILTIITSSVQASTKTTLDICGFTVFFSVLKDIFSALLGSKGVAIIVSSTLEISSGVLDAIRINNTILCAFFTGFSIGFGGLCIYMQTLSVCMDSHINKLRFFCKKFLQGIICGLFATIICKIFNLEPLGSAFTIVNKNINKFNIVLSAFFLFLVICLLKKTLKKKLYSL